MNRARAQWLALEPSVQALLTDLRVCLGQQRLTTHWTAARQDQSLALTHELERAWEQERVALDALRSLDALTRHLDLRATVTCRAALENLQGLFRLVVEATYEELAADD